MTTLETVDGRLLTARRPAQAGFSTGGGFWPTQFPPMWSDGSREGDKPNLRSFEALYRSQPVVAGVVDKLARRIATLPFDCYKRVNATERELVMGDTLDSLIRHPYPRAGTVHLNHHIAQSLLVHGNAAVAKLRGPDPEGPPIMLWPLNWSRMSAYGQPGGRVEWFSTFQFDNAERFMSADDVILFAWPSTDGSEIGVSPLEKLGVTIRLEDAAQRHQISLFRNGSRPSLGVTIDQTDKTGKALSPDDLEYVRSRVEAMHKGADQSGRTFFMGSNVKVAPISMSPVEVALIEQRKVNREEIGAVYDLSGPLMNDLAHGTYSNVTELLRSLYRDVLPPWLGLLEETYQSQLIDQEPTWLDRFCAFDLTDKLKGDPVELATSLKLQVEAGLLTRNEARRILNLPPVDDKVADQLTFNANNQAPIDFHRANQALSETTDGTKVNPPPGLGSSGA